MRRTTRRALINLGFFSLALIIIQYLNRSQPNKSFAWNTIRYRSSSATRPEARGICPGLAHSVKPALVVSLVAADGDPKWLDALASLYHTCVYKADAPLRANSVNLQVPANRGHEAMAYLTFLIDNYNHIPAAGAVFVHGARWAWHNDAPDYDNAALLAALNITAALEPAGYHNLRCDWSASTCPPSDSPPQGSLETSMRAVTEPWNTRVISDKALPRALATLFGGGAFNENDASNSAKGDGRLLLGRTDAVRAQCCAQFVVARERVWAHSRDEYVALRQWLLDGSDDGTKKRRPRGSLAAPSDDRVAGRIVSYLWHILFTDGARDSPNEASGGVELERLNALACPRADTCYCRLYGRCNLPGCTTPGRCRGQYAVPPDYKLPADWPAPYLRDP